MGIQTLYVNGTRKLIYKSCLEWINLPFVNLESACHVYYLPQNSLHYNSFLLHISFSFNHYFVNFSPKVGSTVILSENCNVPRNVQIGTLGYDNRKWRHADLKPSLTPPPPMATPPNNPLPGHFTSTFKQIVAKILTPLPTTCAISSLDVPFIFIASAKWIFFS